MFKTTTILTVFGALFFGSSAALATPVQVHADFTGGIFGNFALQFNTAPAGLKLQSVKFDLQPPLFSDPTSSAPGALLPLSFTPVSGSLATGFSGVTGIADGSTSFTLSFNDFKAGESFNFNLDVDSPCGSLGCQLPASITTGAEFAGTTMSAVFGGPGYTTTTLQGIFDETGAFTASSTINGSLTAAPEPSTMAILGAGLILVGFRARRLQHKR